MVCSCYLIITENINIINLRNLGCKAGPKWLEQSFYRDWRFSKAPFVLDDGQLVNTQVPTSEMIVQVTTYLSEGVVFESNTGH